MGFDIHFLGLLQISSYYLFEFIRSSTFLYTICTPFFPLPQGTNNPPPFFFFFLVQDKTLLLPLKNSSRAG